MNGMNSGEILKIVATDPGSVKDFEAFCRQSGDELLDTQEADGEYTYMIKKS